MNSSAIRRWDRDTAWVALLACCVSAASFVTYYRAGDVLLYGDAVAHINIARRVFDSRTPGLLQLGTVWLPLPHLLTIPFIVNHRLWQSGIGGSIPSMIGFVFAVVGIFRLTGQIARMVGFDELAQRLTALAAAALFGLNPNLLYMQATAMTEALYLALFVWAVAYFVDFVAGDAGTEAAVDQGKSPLWKSGLCVAGACLTRYDGWFLAALLCCVVIFLWLRTGWSSDLFPSVARFLLIAAAVPVLWVAYNAIVYRNPLEFANGPYSAQAIEKKTSVPGAPPHPGTHNLARAAAYFVKSGEINLAKGTQQSVWLLLAVAGSVLLILLERDSAVAWLLWAPIPFYALSIAYGGVPIFMPDWWPYSAYNVRYGLQLLPAFAVLVPLAIASVAVHTTSAMARRGVVAVAAVFLVASYVWVWREAPVCYREARINSRTRLALESQLAVQLEKLPPGSSFLMYLGGHVGALQDAGIPLARSVNEGNHRVWVQPSDPEGLWERSLANPAAFVDYVVAIEGDPVADAMRGKTLPVVASIVVPGQPMARLYQAR